MSKIARGIVTSADAKQVVLQAAGTHYELQLDLANCGSQSAAMRVGEDVQGIIRVRARKVWTMACGGNFIQPLSGSPRLIQGRVKAVEGKTALVQAGTVMVVELPEDSSAYDLKNGAVVPGAMVNLTLYSGASFEPTPSVH